MIYSIFVGIDVIYRDPSKERSHSILRCLYIEYLYKKKTKPKEKPKQIFRWNEKKNENICNRTQTSLNCDRYIYGWE